jgi:DNA sulfur modification protein DndB
MDKSSLAARSRKLFTLSAIYTATISLLDRIEIADRDAATKIAIEYWEEVARHIPEWDSVRQGKVSAGEIRQDYIHSHGIALHALGKVGNYLLLNNPDKWKEKLTKLKKINWSRANSALWEGRAMVGGRLSKAAQHVTLTTVALKTILGVPLDADEESAELARRKLLNV